MRSGAIDVPDIYHLGFASGREGGAAPRGMRA